MRRNAMKQRGTPDRRGMGAQSDFISETFVPSQQHRHEQLRMASVLLSLGIPGERVAAMLSISVESLPSEPPLPHL